MLDEPAHIKIEASGLNWLNIATQLSAGLHNHYGELPDGSSVSVINPGPSGGTRAPIWVGEGKYDMGFCTPSWYLKVAVEGRGLGREGSPLFEKPLPIRTIAVFPHNDRLGLAVRVETNITSLKDIKENKIPLKISMPYTKTHSATWVIQAMLDHYGITLEDIESWGGEILKDRPRFQNSPKSIPIDPGFDAIFDEALTTRRWARVTQTYDLRFLPIDEGVLDRLEDRGMQRGVIEKGRLRGVDQDVPTIDFSGWVLFCREDMPYELGYLTARALDERHEEISEIFAGEYPSIEPVDMHEVGKNPPVPLHEGAEAYYKEKGYL